MKNDLILEFRNWLINQDLSVKTIDEYARRIDKFLKIIDYETDKISDKIIADWFLDLRKKVSPSELNVYRASIVNVLRFLDKENIKVPEQCKIEIKVPDSIDEDYFLHKILPMIDMIFVNYVIKYKAILYLMFYDGLRNKEVPNLKRKDFDLEKRRVKISKTKTHRERMLPLSQKTASLIKLYFSIESEGKSAFNIGNTGIKCLFNKLKPCFPDIRLRPTLFRHSCATHLLAQGLDIAEVSKILGHTNVQTTMHYLNLNIDKLQQKFDKLVK